VQHVIEDAYVHLSNTMLMELNNEQYDGSIHIPGHSCIPKSAFWLRKAGEDNGDTAELSKLMQLESFVMDVCELQSMPQKNLVSSNVLITC
jgi:hypothetical protein